MRSSTAPSAGNGSLRPAEPAPGAPDVRDELFAPIAGRAFAFEITVCGSAVLAGSRTLADRAAEIGVEIEWLAPEGRLLRDGAVVCRARGDAWRVARAEETLMGGIGKASGVATAAAELVAIAGGRARIVCGAWKKVPAPIRADLRHAVAVGGAGMRILDRPFVYLDKNYVRMLGGVAAAVRQARRLEDRAVVVQLRGEAAPIAEEAVEAAAEGADLLVVDTGRVADLSQVAELAASRRLAKDVGVGFAGGVTAATLPAVLDLGAGVVDVGRAILDAPVVDFRLDVR